MNKIIPKISILIPSYNHIKYVSYAVKSIWTQTYQNLELIIVDDGSTDGSLLLLEELKIQSPITMKVFSQKNNGICSALNRGLAESTGDIITFLASDDVMLEDRFSKEIKEFEINPLLKVSYSNGRYYKDDEIFGEVHKAISPYLKKGICQTKEIILSSIPKLYIQALLIKKDFLEEIGGFDEQTNSDDWSLNIRIFKNLRKNNEYYYNRKNFSFLYRVHENQINNSVNFTKPMIKKVIKKYFNLNSRSKLVCKKLIINSIKALRNKEFRKTTALIKKTIKIGFFNGIPYKCLLSYISEIPFYIYRNFIAK